MASILVRKRALVNTTIKNSNDLKELVNKITEIVGNDRYVVEFDEPVTLDVSFSIL